MKRRCQNRKKAIRKRHPDCTKQKQERYATDSTRKFPLDLTKETRGEIVEFLEKVEQSGEECEEALPK